jgi:Phage endonuclease I
MRAGEFDSRFEKELYQKLSKENISVEYEPETFVYKRRTRSTFCNVCGTNDTYRRAKYTPDFRIGKSIYIEAKGYFKPETRAKMEDFISTHPDFDLRFLFGADNWLTGKKLKRYSDWAIALEVPYAIGVVPPSWIKEARKQLCDKQG